MLVRNLVTNQILKNLPQPDGLALFAILLHLHKQVPSLMPLWNTLGSCFWHSILSYSPLSLCPFLFLGVYYLR